MNAISIAQLGTSSFDFEYTSSHIRIVDEESIPEIVVMGSPCRSGSTAILESFSRSDMRSIYQPIKNIIRYGKPSLVLQNDQSSARLFIKETYGPAKERECTYNPIKLLLDAGVPSKKLKYLALFRSPLATYSSWKDFYDVVDIDAYIQSYRNAFAVMQYAKLNQIKLQIVIYEQFKDDSVSVMKDICSFIGIEYVDGLIEWGTRPVAGLDSKVEVIDVMQAPFNSTVTGSKLEYKARDLSNITHGEINMINEKLLVVMTELGY